MASRGELHHIRALRMNSIRFRGTVYRHRASRLTKWSYQALLHSPPERSTSFDLSASHDTVMILSRRLKAPPPPKSQISTHIIRRKSSCEGWGRRSRAEPRLFNRQPGCSGCQCIIVTSCDMIKFDLIHDAMSAYIYI